MQDSAHICFIKQLANSLKQQHWPLPDAADAADSLLGEEGKDPDVSKWFDFVVKENDSEITMNITLHTKGEEVQLKPITNFELLEFICYYESCDRYKPVMEKVRVRYLHDSHGTETLYAGPEHPVDSLDLTNCKYLMIDCLVETTSYDRASEVKTAFKHAYKKLTCSKFTPDMLSDWILHACHSKIPTKMCVVNFGWQRGGIWVFANTTIELLSEQFQHAVTGDTVHLQKVEYQTHEDAGYHVVPSEFENNARFAWQRAHFPSLIVIPQPWVRYVIGFQMWHHFMPDVFLNNLMPAKAMFAAGVMGLYANRLWQGEHGCGRGVPFVWAYSAEHHTGKTTALNLVKALTGQFSCPTWGGTTTEPMIFERTAMQANMIVPIDDVVLSEWSKNHDNSSMKMSNIARMLYEQSTRPVCGAARTPLSQCMFSANTTINDRDTAMVSRMIMLRFAPLQKDDEAPDCYNPFLACSELLSSCVMDFASILWNGDLDRQAIQDCAQFLTKVVGGGRSRSSNCWGLLLYFMLALTVTFQGSDQDRADVIGFVVEHMTKANYEMMNHAGTLDQFILEVHNVRSFVVPDVTKGAAGEVVHLHNYREQTSPAINQFAVAPGEWVAYNVEALIAVLKKQSHRTFTLHGLQEAVKSALPSDVRFTTGRFYDVSKMGFPIVSQHLPVDGTQMATCVPLPEEDLIDGTLHSVKNTLFVRKKFVDEIIASIQKGVKIDTPVERVVITRMRTAEDYNFWERVVHMEPTPWDGFRFGEQCSFSPFFYHNKMHIGGHTDLRIDAAVEQATQDSGYGSVEHMYNPLSLLEWYKSFQPNTDPSVLPPCYKFDPFEYANGETVGLVMPREPFYGDFGGDGASLPPMSPQVVKASDSEPNSQSSTPLSIKSSNCQTVTKTLSPTVDLKRKRSEAPSVAATDDPPWDDEVTSYRLTQTVVTYDIPPGTTRPYRQCAERYVTH